MILAKSILVSTKGDKPNNTLDLQARLGLEDATTFGITTLSIITLSIMTLSIMTLSIMTLSIMTLSIMALSIMSFFAKVSINDAQHKWYYIESCYAECRYAECHLEYLQDKTP